MPDDIESAANRQVRARLEENLKELVAEQQGFGKVIGFLRDATNANVFVNWTALQAVGIDRNTPVSVNLREIPIRKALATILSEVGGGLANLAYTIEDGFVIISTRDDLDGEKYQVVYVHDLRGVFPAGATEQQVHDLIDTIKITIAPSSWRDSGGMVGTIHFLNNQLIINQTRDNHIAIAELLNSLGKPERGQGAGRAPASFPASAHPENERKVNWTESNPPPPEVLAASWLYNALTKIAKGPVYDFSTGTIKSADANAHEVTRACLEVSAFARRGDKWAALALPITRFQRTRDKVDAGAAADLLREFLLSDACRPPAGQGDGEAPRKDPPRSVTNGGTMDDIDPRPRIDLLPLPKAYKEVFAAAVRLVRANPSAFADAARWLETEYSVETYRTRHEQQWEAIRRSDEMSAQCAPSVEELAALLNGRGGYSPPCSWHSKDDENGDRILDEHGNTEWFFDQEGDDRRRAEAEAFAQRHGPWLYKFAMDRRQETLAKIKEERLNGRPVSQVERLRLALEDLAKREMEIGAEAESHARKLVLLAYLLVWHDTRDDLGEFGRWPWVGSPTRLFAKSAEEAKRLEELPPGRDRVLFLWFGFDKRKVDSSVKGLLRALMGPKKGKVTKAIGLLSAAKTQAEPRSGQDQIPPPPVPAPVDSTKVTMFVDPFADAIDAIQKLTEAVIMVNAPERLGFTDPQGVFHPYHAGDALPPVWLQQVASQLSAHRLVHRQTVKAAMDRVALTVQRATEAADPAMVAETSRVQNEILEWGALAWRFITRTAAEVVDEKTLDRWISDGVRHRQFLNQLSAHPKPKQASPGGSFHFTRLENDVREQLDQLKRFVSLLKGQPNAQERFGIVLEYFNVLSSVEREEYIHGHVKALPSDKQEELLSRLKRIEEEARKIEQDELAQAIAEKMARLTANRSDPPQGGGGEEKAEQQPAPAPPEKQEAVTGATVGGAASGPVTLAVGAAAITEKYVFRRKDKVWEIRFDEESGYLEDSKGLQHIHWLLQSPGKPVPAVELMGVDQSTLVLSNDGGGTFLDREKAEQLLQARGRIRDDLARNDNEDRNTLEQEKERIEGELVAGIRGAKERLEELRRLESELDDVANDEREAELRSQAEGVVSALLDAASAKGRQRNLEKTPSERAADAVRASINKVYKTLEKEQKGQKWKKLLAHLRENVNTGQECSCNVNDVSWTLG